MFQLFTDFNFTDLLKPEWYIERGGLYLMLFVIFAETGLFAGFFLPGDSLLFVAGIYSNKLAQSFYDTGNDFTNLVMVIILVALAGILGNIVGYWFGKKSGPSLYKRGDTFFFKQRHLQQAKTFYEQNGGFTIIAARFVPFVRTFAPIVAGIVQMDYKKFMFFNIIGSITWAISMMASGHYLYKFCLNQFNFDLTKHLEVIVLGIIFITTMPVIYKVFKARSENAKQ